MRQQQSEMQEEFYGPSFQAVPGDAHTRLSTGVGAGYRAKISHIPAR